LPLRPTVQSAVLPAATPESATDFLGFGPLVGVVSLNMVSELLQGR
jgi:hypothetical protein